MSQQMIIWCIIVGVLLFAFALRAFERLYLKCHNDRKKAHHIFELGNEREMFYCPGDVTDDDFDD